MGAVSINSIIMKHKWYISFATCILLSVKTFHHITMHVRWFIIYLYISFLQQNNQIYILCYRSGSENTLILRTDLSAGRAFRCFPNRVTTFSLDCISNTESFLGIAERQRHTLMRVNLCREISTPTSQSVIFGDDFERALRIQDDDSLHTNDGWLLRPDDGNLGPVVVRLQEACPEKGREMISY